MRSVVDLSESNQAYHALTDIIDIINRCKRFESQIDRDNCILDLVNKNMSYDLSESEKLLAKFGDRVSIIVGLEVGGKITEQDAFEKIRTLYKELKNSYKPKKKNKTPEGSEEQ